MLDRRNTHQSLLVLRLDSLGYLPHGESRGGRAAKNVVSSPSTTKVPIMDDDNLTCRTGASKLAWTAPLVQCCSLRFVLGTQGGVTKPSKTSDRLRMSVSLANYATSTSFASRLCKLSRGMMECIEGARRTVAKTQGV